MFQVQIKDLLRRVTQALTARSSEGQEELFGSLGAHWRERALLK